MQVQRIVPADGEEFQMDPKEFDRLFRRSAQSDVIQATRRLIFTHCSVSLEESGVYYADTVYSKGGTGILIKFQNIFFLLTAQHVIDENYDALQNEAPFFVTASAKPLELTDEEMLWPMRGWRIGPLTGLDVYGIDMDDVVLIELSSMPLRHPDRFIDLDSRIPTLTLDLAELSPGLALCCAGFPIEHNPIDYDFDAEPRCVATVHRHAMLAFCKRDVSTWIAETYLPHDHKALNGMSGGAVCNVDFDDNPVRWVGMMQKGGSGIIRFYPAGGLIAAIKNFRQAHHYIIDPAARLGNLEIEATEDALTARGEYLRWIKAIGEVHSIDVIGDTDAAF